MSAATTSAIDGLVKEIHDAIAELAGVRRYPDLSEAIGTLALLAVTSRQGLQDATSSLETIHCLGGRGDHLMTMSEVRGYAESRATAAREALAHIDLVRIPALSETYHADC